VQTAIRRWVSCQRPVRKGIRGPSLVQRLERRTAGRLRACPAGIAPEVRRRNHSACLSPRAAAPVGDPPPSDRLTARVCGTRLTRCTRACRPWALPKRTISWKETT